MLDGRARCPPSLASSSSQFWVSSIDVYEHLLVALDGSPAAERVLEHTEALAKAVGSTVTLFRATVAAEALMAQTATGGQAVGDVGPMLDPTPILEADRAEAVSYLNGAAARLKQHNLNVTTE